MTERRVSVGAEIVQGGAHFRVFAPKRKHVEIALEGQGTITLAREEDGHFSGFADGVSAGTLYRLSLDRGERVIPDPASRFQPDGPHGPSEIIDPKTFEWTDRDWRGVTLEGQVVYEMHIGTFTREGTYRAAAKELDELKNLGVTLIEIMPVAEFPGRFGWGYDGVDLYAPTRLYGRPDDLRAFIDRAHALGVGVILDVVYNHLGPSGNYLRELSEHYFTDRYDNEWGDALDFETERGARSYFVENAAYWIDEFHFDGLRLDATQSIHDRSAEHVISELGRAARTAAAKAGRSIVIFAENERQEAKLCRPIECNGYGLDAVWNDDFHHSARVVATGKAEAYYSPTKGTPQELISAVKWGYLFQGQHYRWQKNRRGAPALDLPAKAFTNFIENHDQVSNSIDGSRLHQLTTPGVYRALTTLFLLAPGTPLLFQGQEFASSKPFVYFADHEPDLAKLVAKGRAEFLAQFPSLATEEAKQKVPVPHELETFERCKLDLTEREKNRAAYDLHRDLLRLRREDPAFAAQDNASLHGTVLAPKTFALRFATGTGKDRLVVINLGDEHVDIGGIGDPLLAPIEGHVWRVAFSTEDPKYGGAKTQVELGSHGEIRVPASCAIVFEATEEETKP